MTRVFRMPMAATLLLASPVVLSAGWLDNLKKAAQPPAQQTQQNAPQSGAPAQPSAGGSPSGGLGATSVNTDFPTCMAQSNGSHEKLLSQVLQRKLKSGASLAPQERQHIQAAKRTSLRRRPTLLVTSPNLAGLNARIIDGA